MSHSALITSQKKQERPILIVDRHGLIGEALARQLKSEALIVFVSKRPSLDKEELDTFSPSNSDIVELAQSKGR